MAAEGRGGRLRMASKRRSGGGTGAAACVARMHALHAPTHRLNIWLPSTSTTRPAFTAGSSALQAAQAAAAAAGLMGRAAGAHERRAAAPRRSFVACPAAQRTCRQARGRRDRGMPNVTTACTARAAHHSGSLASELSSSLRVVGRSSPHSATITQSGRESARACVGTAVELAAPPPSLRDGGRKGVRQHRSRPAAPRRARARRQSQRGCGAGAARNARARRLQGSARCRAPLPTGPPPAARSSLPLACRGSWGAARPPSPPAAASSGLP